MTDEEFVFRTDCREKKVTGHSAAKRVGKRKKVTFPSDNLTKKEIAKMNGEVKSYNLKQPMKWAEYKRMPDDLRREYINRLRNLYNATDGALGKMFGCSDQTVRVERKALGIPSLKKNARVSPEFGSFIKFGTPDAAQRAEIAKDEPKAPVKLDPLEVVEPVKAEATEARPKNVSAAFSIGNRDYVVRALGIIEGVAGTLDNGVSDVLHTALEMLELGLGKMEG